MNFSGDGLVATAANLDGVFTCLAGSNRTRRNAVGSLATGLIAPPGRPGGAGCLTQFQTAVLDFGGIAISHCKKARSASGKPHTLDAGDPPPFMQVWVVRSPHP